MAGWPSFAPAESAENVPPLAMQQGKEAGVSSAPLPPAKLASPRLKLETVKDVRRELARIYREARRGELKPETATKLAFLLDLTSRMIERSELEARIEALEGQGQAR
jgi:hypothetical protein